MSQPPCPSCQMVRGDGAPDCKDCSIFNLQALLVEEQVARAEWAKRAIAAEREVEQRASECAAAVAECVRLREQLQVDDVAAGATSNALMKHSRKLREQRDRLDAAWRQADADRTVYQRERDAARDMVRELRVLVDDLLAKRDRAETELDRLRADLSFARLDMVNRKDPA